MSIMHRVSENQPLLYMSRIKTINVSARDTVSSPFKTDSKQTRLKLDIIVLSIKNKHWERKTEKKIAERHA